MLVAGCVLYGSLVVHGKSKYQNIIWQVKTVSHVACLVTEMFRIVYYVSKCKWIMFVKLFCDEVPEQSICSAQYWWKASLMLHQSDCERCYGAISATLALDLYPQWRAWWIQILYRCGWEKCDPWHEPSIPVWIRDFSARSRIIQHSQDSD